MRLVLCQLGGGSPTVVSSNQLVTVNPLQVRSLQDMSLLVESHSGSEPQPGSPHRAAAADEALRVPAELGQSLLRTHSIPIGTPVSSQTTRAKPYILCKQPGL